MFQIGLSRREIGKDMKVKLTEHYQDVNHILVPEQEVEVSHELGTWLVEHRKAVKLEVVAPVVELPAEPVGPFNAAKIVEEEPHPVDEPAEEAPKPSKRKRGKQ
jgi:hypothetical protein